MLNSVTIHVIRKTSSLLKPSLLLSLAVYDLGVGLLVLPLHIALLIMKLEQTLLASVLRFGEACLRFY